MKDQQRFDRIAELCGMYLSAYYKGPIHRPQEIIPDLHEATKPQAPPALGIAVSDAAVTEDRVGG